MKEDNNNDNNNKIFKDFPPNPLNLSHIHLGYWDYFICCMPFVFKSYCLFWGACSNFLFYLFYTFDFSNKVFNIDELFFSGLIYKPVT